MPTPQHCPTPRELADLELLTGGAFAPVTGFNEPGSPVTLDLPARPRRPARSSWSTPRACRWRCCSPTAPSRRSRTPSTGRSVASTCPRPRSARPTPAPRSSRSSTPSPRTRSSSSAALGTPVVLLALTGPGTPELSPVALLRASLAAAGRLPEAAVVAVPLASHGDPVVDHDLGVRVVAAYAGPDPVLALGDAGDGDYPDDIAAIVDADRPGPGRQGLVLFFTGLSGQREVDRRAGGHRPPARARRAHGHQPRRRRRTPEPVGGPHLQPRGPRDQHPPDRLGRRRDLPTRRGGRLQPDRAVRRDPAGRPRDDRGRRRCLLPRARRHPAGGVRAARPQGPLRQGPPRRDPRLHRDLLALRGARRTPTCASTPPVAPSRTAATRCSTPSPRAGYVSAERPRRRAGGPSPIRVLFVCTANICRSPYLELRARQLLGPDSGVEVSSAGHPRLRRLAGQRHDGRGVRALGHRDRRLPQPAGDRRPDRRGRPGAHGRGRAPHPAPGGASRRVPQGLHARPVRGERPGGRSRPAWARPARGPRDAAASRHSPDHDIADPYRRGPEAAAAAAVTMEAMLEVVVERLRDDRRA